MLESLFNKETPTQVFFCKTCKIFKNTVFLQNTSFGCFLPIRSFLKVLTDFKQKNGYLWSGCFISHHNHFPADIVRKLNVLCTFNLRPVSTGSYINNYPLKYILEQASNIKKSILHRWTKTFKKLFSHLTFSH